MKIETNIANILELMDRPAFCVSGGIVCETNHASRARMISPGTEVHKLIFTGQKEYDNFHSGCLYLTLTVAGQNCGACVTRLGDMDIFTMESADSDPELRAYALAAQELRQPLSHVLSVYDQLFPTMEEMRDPASAEQLARMNRSLHQLLRLVGNMSDAVTAGTTKQELRDVTAVMREIIDHAEPLCRSAQVSLSFTNHPVSVYSLVDTQKLERAVYNLLSNALKYASPGDQIDVQLRRRGNSLYLSVTDAGSEETQTLSPGMFHRFLREPGIEDCRTGLGLGLTLVRAAAAAHHGALLMDQTDAGRIRATLSLPIQQDTTSLRSTPVRIDYAGERDHGLIELSESLPPEVYSPKAT